MDAQIQSIPEDPKIELVSLEAPLGSNIPPSRAETPPTSPLSLIEQRERKPVTIGTLSPVQRLPVELLAEIFSLTIRDKDPEHFQDAYRVYHVCSQWQQVAATTPRLWTGAVTVTVTKTLPAKNVDGLRAWLARSAPLSLPVYLEGPIPPDTDDTGAFPPVLEALLQVAPRWRLLYADKILPEFYERLAKYSLDSLEEANLTTRHPSVPFLTTAPRLHTLELEAHPLLRVPWGQLTKLDLHETSSVCLGIIAQCSNLTELMVYTDATYQHDIGTIVANLPRLQTLRVQGLSDLDGPEQLDQLLDVLHAPALDALEIYSDISWTQAVFTAFQLRSQHLTHLRIEHCSPMSNNLGIALRYAPLLTHLSLRQCDFSSNELIGALVHAPSLTHLGLEYCMGLNNIFILGLYDTGNSPPLVPRLHDFSLFGTVRLDMTEGCILGMLLSRCRTDEELASAPRVVARWSHVVLECPYNAHAQRRSFTIHFQAELERRGLRVKTGEYWYITAT
ncbi:hypothetical protein C8R46DRAFT_1281202 [Mycena filopes]|nr:hypothetical protein C8R46DRAFT_1281202 [Mycena filopes]